MHVRSLTATQNRRHREKLDATVQDLQRAAKDKRFVRIAFVGRVPRGLAGVALDLNHLRVMGHKLEPIPENLLDRVVHFPLEGMRDALRAASQGVDMLAGDVEHGFMIRWNGPSFEIFAAGDDSEESSADGAAPLPH